MRSAILARVNLLVNALKLAIEDVARAKGVARPRVLDKVNARGDIVIALILPAEPKERASREEVRRRRKER